MSRVDFAPWSEFLNEIRAAEDALGRPHTVWYRGVPNAGFACLPSLLRRERGVAVEREVFETYVRLSAVIHPERRSSWEMLFDMQHYQVPTRLLDWTEVLGVAVFFSMVNAAPNIPGAIYVLDPLSLNRASEFPDVDDPDFDYRKLFLEGNESTPMLPRAIRGRLLNRRIFAQRGVFTVHGSDMRPLEEQFPMAVRKVPVSLRIRQAAKEFLRASGINSFSVFPDIVGLAPHLETMFDSYRDEAPPEADA